ncbi:MAG: His-Xaa-Ser system protein HxsD [Acidobacteria bacterium]|nr:His-Xaa-Ser system protein HxsD [Acidobacteriota bacterium]
MEEEPNLDVAGCGADQRPRLTATSGEDAFSRGIAPSEVSLGPVRLGEQLFALEVDTSVFEVPALIRACYRLTERWYLFLARREEEPSRIVVSFWPRIKGHDAGRAAQELGNELIDQQLREDLSRRMQGVRELILAQAFAEGDLLDPQREGGDYESDPAGIGQSRFGRAGPFPHQPRAGSRTPPE